MKKILLIIAILIPSLLFAQSDNFQISGKIGNLNSPAKAYITFANKAEIQKDSVVIVNGEFTLKGMIEGPVLANVFISRDGIPPRLKKSRSEFESLQIYLEAANLMLAPADSLSHSYVLNSKINDDLRKLNSELKRVDDKIVVLNAEYAAATTDEGKKSIIDRGKALDAERRTIRTLYVKEHPNSILSLDQIKVIGGINPDFKVVQPMFDGLDESLKESIAGRKYITDLHKLSDISIGTMAPDFEQPDTAGKMVKLSAYRGKYVLLDFWASWCGPCRAENPNLVKNYGLYHPKGFEVLGVSLDQPGKKEAWLKAIKADNLSWTQVSDLKFWNNSAAVLYGITGIPANFLIGPDGKIVAKNLKREDLTRKLEEIFGERK